jgi:rhodanese-related sulfurtransferase
MAKNCVVPSNQRNRLFLFRRAFSVVKSCDKKELQSFIRSGNCFLIDVREQMEVAQTGPVDRRALNIPLMDFVTDEDGSESLLLDRLDENEFLDEYGIEKPSFDDNIIFTCKAGSRSNMAATFLLNKNSKYKSVFNYLGGADDWFH